MHFVIIARDGPGGPAHRQAHRADHLRNIAAFHAQGRIIDGGALLDEVGEMAGSVMICDFPDRAALDVYLAGEPYAVFGVWRDIEVAPLHRVDWQAIGW